MNKLAKDIFRHIVPVNEGYDYLFTDEIYIPVYETSLLITKRIIMPISLVEEKILQLLDIGLSQIDEITKVLGLNRSLLEVTLADLYSKDLVAVSSNSCRITSSGREALNNLKRIEKKQDILKNVCIDGIFGNVVDASDYTLLTNIRDDDSKLRPKVPLGEVQYYVEQFRGISQIFEEENKLFFSEGIQPEKEELLIIDKVHSTFVKFIKIPIHTYVSSNGIDIDIVAENYKMEELLKEYKDYIIEQINCKKVLKNHFKSRYVSNQQYYGQRHSEKKELIDELKNINYCKDKKNIDYDSIKDRVLSNRKLFKGEYRDILKHLSMSVDKIELYVDDLENWVYDSNFTKNLVEDLGKAKLIIHYNNSSNEKKSLKHIKFNYKEVYQCKKTDDGYYICWKIGDYLLYGIPTVKNVINEKTTCLVTDFYLENHVESSMKPEIKNYYD